MKLIKEAFDLILPRTCSVCGGTPDADGKLPYDVPEDFHICFNCLSSIIPQPADKRFFLCLSEPYEGDPHPGLALYMPFAYRGFFEEAVPRAKFRSHPEIAEFMGQLLGSFMDKDGIKADLAVPVPLSHGRLKERGYNQADLIAGRAAAAAGIPYAADVLMRTRETLRQTEITDDAQRSLNMKGAFSCSSAYDIGGLNILLIDDVATTGNTLHEAACALFDAGAANVSCAAVCGNRAVLNAEAF